MSELKILYLGQDDVIAAGGMNMRMVIDTMEKTFAIHGNKDYVLPSKTSLRWGDAKSETIRGRINSMPAYIGGEFDAAGIKWIAGFPPNITQGLPRASALIILNDPYTGLPLAVMDGTLISAMRTGANTGVAAKYLARPDSHKLALIGAGVQNRTQLMALKESLPNLETVKIFDINPERAKEFAVSMGEELNLSIQPVGTAAEAVHDADVLVTATVCQEPVVSADMVPEGAFYSHVGSHECTFDVIRQSGKAIVDDWEEIKHRGVETIAIMHAEGLFKDEDLYAELGEIVTGRKPGREKEEEKIYFATVGLGIEDIALAKVVYERAKEQGLGNWLTVWQEPVFK